MVWSVLVWFDLVWSDLAGLYFVLDNIRIHGSSDDSCGIYAFIHWRNVKCHACGQTGGRKMENSAVFCWGRIRKISLSYIALIDP